VSTFLIGYDLDKPGQNYEGLAEKIKSLGPWWHYLDSTWLVKSDSDHVAIRDQLSSVLDSNDKLLVVNVSGAAAAWCGFSQRGGKWLQDNI
jgi:hypothetical protein